MEKKMAKPELSVVRFYAEDILCTSNIIPVILQELLSNPISNDTPPIESGDITIDIG